MQHAVHGLHLEAALRADLLHQRKVAAASAAETEVVADQHKLHGQFFMQHTDEIIRAQLRKLFVEAAHMHAINAE